MPHVLCCTGDPSLGTKPAPTQWTRKRGGCVEALYRMAGSTRADGAERLEADLASLLAVMPSPPVEITPVTALPSPRLRRAALGSGEAGESGSSPCRHGMPSGAWCESWL
jgi:hypothetical protein